MVELYEWLNNRSEIKQVGENGSTRYQLKMPLPSNLKALGRTRFVESYMKRIVEARGIEYKPENFDLIIE